MQIAIPQKIENLLERLEAAGFESYAVGGAVRDSLAGCTPSDWDLCTSARPEQIMAVFSDRHLVDVGAKHGTVQVDGTEITTFRAESGYSDNRHPDNVEFVTDIRLDLARRDFTINAMAYSSLHGLTDPFGGRDDLKHGILRCVGDPVRRFAEDALRILRALRFMATRGFTPDQATEDALRSGFEAIRAVSAQRVTEELKKLLCGESAACVLDDYREIFACIIPELEATFDFDQRSPYHNRDVWHHILAAVDDIPPVFELRMTMLLHDIAKPVVFVLDNNGRGRFVGHPQKGAEMAEQILKRLRLPKETIQRITRLVAYHDYKIKPERPSVRRILSVFGPEGLEDLLAVRHADAAGKYEKYLGEIERKNEEIRRLAAEILRDGDCISLKTLAISGKDLTEDGLPPGPVTGEILKTLLDAVIDGKLENEKSALLDAARAEAQKTAAGVREK